MKPHDNPVDYFNKKATVRDIFGSNKDYTIVDDASVVNTKTKQKYEIVGDKVNNGTATFTKFEMMTIARFKSNPHAAMQWAYLDMVGVEIPYIRVATDYYVEKSAADRYGIKHRTLMPWKRQTLIDDFGKDVLNKIPVYDSFCMVPENINYRPVIDGQYNRYNPFPHRPADEPATLCDFMHIHNLICHVFGEQFLLGYKYLKVLYESPKQKLPVLVLTSKERQTGKTTFLNLMAIIFGQNYSLISPEEFASSFNTSYAHSNIIGIDETVIDKSHIVEKIKSVVTAPTINVNNKFITPYKVDFFGKVILCTNKESDFMRIDDEEIRFWVRKVPVLPEIITDIESKMIEEVPAFLRYLTDNVDQIDYSRSRMVFTDEEIRTEQIDIVKKESRSGLHKEIELLVEEYFDQNEYKSVLQVSAIDIKNKWFPYNSQISSAYISKVLKKEMNIENTKDPIRYNPFDGENKVGRPFIFYRTDKKIPYEGNIPF